MELSIVYLLRIIIYDPFNRKLPDGRLIPNGFRRPAILDFLIILTEVATLSNLKKKPVASNRMGLNILQGK